MNKEKIKLNFVQKKIIYLNAVYLFVFILGATLAIIGFSPLVDNEKHFWIIETFGIPMVTAALTYWALETKAYIKIRHAQEQKEEKATISHPAVDLAEWLTSQGWEKKEGK